MKEDCVEGMVREMGKPTVAGFTDLEVYRNSYKAMLMVFADILPLLPAEEKFDLRDQLSRSAKAVPRLIAEGHAKRHQKRGFQKYIDDAHAEANESIVSICQVRDLYGNLVDKEKCNVLVDLYDMISRQLYNLALAWEKMSSRSRPTPDDSPDATS